MRGIVWYGVQTYFASKAVEVLVITLMPSAAEFTHNNVFGLSKLGWASFLFMWFFQLVIFLAGMESIRKFIDFCGPIVYLVMFVLAGWMISKTGLDSFSMQLSDKKHTGIESIDDSPARTRRVLRSTAAPILSSLVRIVAVQACASSVPCSARRRRLIISV